MSEVYYAIASGQVLCTEADDYPSFSKHEAHVLWGRPCPDCKAQV